MVNDFVSAHINLYGIVAFYEWVRVSDGSAIVSGQIWDVSGQDTQFFNTAQFVFAFIDMNSVQEKSTFGVIDKSEKFTGLFNGNNI